MRSHPIESWLGRFDPALRSGIESNSMLRAIELGWRKKLEPRLYAACLSRPSE